MAVVISDFEVVTAPPPAAAEPASRADSVSDKGEKPSLEEAFARFQDRIERVRAH